MRRNNNIKFREVDRILKRNGFAYDKTRGSHFQYVRDGRRVVVTREINACVWLRLIKENNLEV
jgi:predicted RNA binding protein YcfA (HicA-like mRNA interferase family)